MDSAHIQGNIRDVIPWPVKSDSYSDVKRTAVAEFFRNAPPRNTDPADTVKLMRSECTKWHPDKSTILFCGNELNSADRMILEMICHVLYEIRNEAQSQR